MFKNQVFKKKICVVCNREYIPLSSIQKSCSRICRNIQVKEYKKKWSMSNIDLCNKRSREWYKRNIARAREIRRKWNNSERGKEIRNEWYMNNRVKVYDSLAKNKDKSMSRQKANRIVKRLGIDRICFSCGSTERVEIHHKDINVFNNLVANLVLLCRKCHSKLHSDRRLELDQNPI